MDHLLTEARNPASTNLDEMTPLEIVRLMNAEDAKVTAAVAQEAEAIARAIDVIADRLRGGGRLIYAGAGTSGRLGVLDATECPPTFNSPPGQVVGVIAGGPKALTQAVEGAEDHPELAERDLQDLQLAARDVVVGIATSGRTPYVIGAVAFARRLGAYAIGLSCNPDSELQGQVDLAITVAVGPEVLSGSTRLKAGTATKLVLNMLTTGAMVRLGKTYGNLMVDLRATNEKLRARTNRIVRQLTGLSVDAAEDLLRRAGGELKTALVTHLRDTTPEEARQKLDEANGQVSKALRDVGTAAVPSQVRADLVLGIDGGGSHTVALLARREPGGKPTILGKGEAGPSNLQAVGGPRAFAALELAVRGAFAAAGIERSTVGSACLGLAGAGRREDQGQVLEWARSVKLAERVETTTDAALLLAAGTPEGWGLAIVAGTGSIAHARGPDGKTARSGGWGYLLGDEGSGYAIALAGLRAAARTADKHGPSTSLVERFLRRLDLAQPQDLIPKVYGGSLDRPALAALACVVLGAAADGDPVAAAIVTREAEALAETAASAATQVFGAAAQIPLALAGGLLLAQAQYRQIVVSRLRSYDVTPLDLALVHDPAEGAVRLADRSRSD